jgi:hypothetical protein
VKRIAASGTWDRLPEEIVSLITVKVVETSEAPLEDLHSVDIVSSDILSRNRKTRLCKINLEEEHSEFLD